ncbi:MAG: S-ribosylhomocysteine lyase, partial [Muribaculaceae bacterium]|nr:S-ribosylhomocysteine lyase [Muribaculaceae bacterium]
QIVADFEGTEADIPGASPRDCGNYSFMDLEGARAAARAYLYELSAATPANFTYPA